MNEKEPMKNVLLMGISGAGKSTLVNAVVGQTVAKVVKGDAGTQEICSYENRLLGLCFVDTRGFEFNLLNQHKTVADMKKLIKKGLTEDEGESRNTIDCIWYCTEATSEKVHGDNIKTLASIIKIWADIPVIVVLTKSYSKIEQQSNINMVNIQFAKHGKKINLQAVIPVVAEPYPIEEGYTVEKSGIEELIETTQRIIDIEKTEEGKQEFRKKQRDYNAQLIVNGTAAIGGTVGAIPFIVHDAVPLMALETAMIARIGKLYGLREDGENGKQVGELLKTLVATGTVGTVAKTIVGAIKAIPGVGLAASVLNAIMAGVIIELLGQVSIVVFKNIESGELDLGALDKIKDFIEAYVNEKMPDILKTIGEYFEQNKENIDIKSLIKAIWPSKEQ